MSVTAPRDTEERPVCSACRDGEHGKCNTAAWSVIRDKPGPCWCWVYNHEGATSGFTAA